MQLIRRFEAGGRNFRSSPAEIPPTTARSDWIRPARDPIAMNQTCFQSCVFIVGARGVGISNVPRSCVRTGRFWPAPRRTSAFTGRAGKSGQVICFSAPPSHLPSDAGAPMPIRRRSLVCDAKLSRFAGCQASPGGPLAEADPAEDVFQRMQITVDSV